VSLLGAPRCLACGAPSPYCLAAHRSPGHGPQAPAQRKDGPTEMLDGLTSYLTKRSAN